DQLVPIGSAMPLLRPLLQHVADAGLRSYEGIGRNPQTLRQDIRRLEADAVNIQRQAIGILGHLENGFVAVGLVDPDRSRGADAVGLEKHHDVPDHLLFRPGCGDPLPPPGTDAFDLREALRRLLNNVEHRFPESPDQFPGEMRADAFHHARAQILFDTFQGTRRNHPKLARLELQAVLAVVDPDTDTLDLLARGD